MTSRLVASASSLTAAANGLRCCAAAAGTTLSCGPTAVLHRPRGGEFLIVDARFPRSIMHGLIAATDSLEKVAQNNMLTARHAQTAVRLLGQLRARLEYADLDDLLDNLNREMSAVQDVAAQVTITVSTSYFAAADPTAWITEGTR